MSQSSILKIGHRGACGYEPENTLHSFRKALELDVDVIELDVRICKSGELVIIHDSKVDRTTNGTGHVVEKTFAELRALDAGRGEKIPTLQEALNLINKRAKVAIELKGKGTAKPVANLIEGYVQKRGWAYNDFFIFSLRHRELLEFSKVSPNVKTGMIIMGVPVMYSKFAKKIHAHVVSPALAFVNRRFVSSVHKKGLKVFVWTVNSKEDIQRMKLLNVDGIASDYPDRI